MIYAPSAEHSTQMSVSAPVRNDRVDVTMLQMGDKFPPCEG